jgi:predicted transglutaminase-like cysteine proteinase
VSIVSQVRAAARVVSVVCLVTPVGTVATAHSVSTDALAAYSLASLPFESRTVPARPEPFGTSVAKDNPLAERWHTMQSSLDAETRLLELCRANPQACPPAAKRFLAIVDAARKREGRARLGEINRAINLAIRSESDQAQYGTTDLWATPLMTFASGAGDCEDYAIAKYAALRLAGIADDDLRLVIVHDRRLNQDHAVVAARVDGRWLVLDNRTMLLLADADVANVTPLFALDSGRDNNTPMLITASR